MNRLLITICMIISLVCSSFWVVLSADLNKGWDAYLKGDYTTALKEFKPLAEGGDKDAQYLLASLSAYVRCYSRV